MCPKPLNVDRPAFVADSFNDHPCAPMVEEVRLDYHVGAHECVRAAAWGNFLGGIEMPHAVGSLVVFSVDPAKDRQEECTGKLA